MDKEIFMSILNFFSKTAQAKIYDRSQLKKKYNYPDTNTSNNFISRFYRQTGNIKYYEDFNEVWFENGLKCMHFMNGDARNKNHAFKWANFHICNPNLKTDLAVEIGLIFSDNKTLDNNKEDNYDTIRGYYVTLFETGYEKHKNRHEQTRDNDKKNYKTYRLNDIDSIYNYVNELLFKISRNMKSDISFLDSMIKLLKSCKNLIFTGAPGTGKTYFAKKIAEQMIGITNGEELEQCEQFAFVQFHPSYEYSDFVEGLRPTKPDDNGNVGFEIKDGIFKKFCFNALQNQIDTQSIELVKPKNYVFVIDEINRGEISKIFGELFFSIDPNYRGRKGAVKTQYSNMHEDPDDDFYVPENVYIIGTMNDIDRSVESFDFAMRRRFTWKEITAEQSAEIMDLPKEIKDRMAKLNMKISETDGLNASYHVGGAYFLDADGKPRADYETIWEFRLEPLLKEYLRGMSEIEKKLEDLKKAYNVDINNGQ